jgi:2-polyprenyl-6-methoxyphenol hydroxylase-like FAD-dependent oxidoreductase
VEPNPTINRDAPQRDGALDVLIVGAGPTGLALAAQLRSFGVGFRIVDRSLDRARESRALAVQARTLEVLQSVGLADALVARGNPSARLVLHFEGGRTAEVRLGGFAAGDTRFPFILFVSQAETEALLGSHLTSHGVTIERGVELADFVTDDGGVDVVLRRLDGHDERVRARFLVGCDGAHSAVRKQAGIAFEGDAYLQDFMLGDLEVDAAGPVVLEPNALHSFGGRQGTAMFFPLGRPATWRVIAMSGRATERSPTTTGRRDAPLAGELSLAELQAVVDGATDAGVRLRDPAWLAHFRLHHRQALRYRAGRVFLAGDAGHIHSPVGAQGMNTGIQDAWNLGWKLALVATGAADPTLLDSYEAERWPVGRALLRSTDRIFSVFTRSMSSSAVAAWVRRSLVARVLPRVMEAERVRAFAFRFLSEFSIRYPRSPVVTEGTPSLRKGPRAGDRLPDAAVTRNGRETTLQRELVGPCLHVLLCGPVEAWSAHADAVAKLSARPSLVTARYLTRSAAPDALVDDSGVAFATLGVRETAQYLVRPDGYVAYRCEGTNLGGVRQYLDRWFTPRHLPRNDVDEPSG